MAAAGGIVQGIAGIAGVAQGYHENSSAVASTNDAVMFGMQNMEYAQELDSLMNYYGSLGMDNAQAMLDDWESAFGSVQDNMADYYNNLDPLKFSQEAKTTFGMNLDKQMKQLNETLAQKGLQSSGQSAQLQKEAAFTKASTNANIDINAPEEVAKMKMNWLNYGAPQKSNADQAMIGAVDNAAKYTQIGQNAIMSANTDIQNILTGKAAASGQSAAGWVSGGATMLGQGASNLNAYYNQPTQQTSQPSGNLSDGTTIDASSWGGSN